MQLKIKTVFLKNLILAHVSRRITIAENSAGHMMCAQSVDSVHYLCLKNMYSTNIISTFTPSREPEQMFSLVFVPIKFLKTLSNNILASQVDASGAFKEL